MGGGGEGRMWPDVTPKSPPHNRDQKGGNRPCKPPRWPDPRLTRPGPCWAWSAGFPGTPWFHGPSPNPQAAHELYRCASP